MLFISSPPNDSFTKRLFYRLTFPFNFKSDILYLWSATLEPNYTHLKLVNETSFDSDFEMIKELQIRNTIKQSISKDIIIIGVKDHLTSGFSNPYDKPLLAEYLYDMFSFYKNKKFILFTSLENLSYYFDNKNVFIVPWGGDITNQKYEYQNLDPLIDKNLESTKSFICLNRHLRSHRLINILNLYSLNLDKFGLISFLFKNEIPNNLSFDTEKNLDPHLKDILYKGYELFSKSIPSIQDDPSIYIRPNDNVYNFKYKLSKHYREVFVEIISETSGFEKSFLITEKTMNSIMACNFPIWISSQGIVSFLRDMGLDVFDDVVNHSYDQIEDPYLRYYQAISLNKELLTNLEKTKYLWTKNHKRFENNISFMKNNLYDFYQHRAEQQFEKIWKNLNEL